MEIKNRYIIITPIFEEDWIANGLSNILDYIECSLDAEGHDDHPVEFDSFEEAREYQEKAQISGQIVEIDIIK